MIIWFASVAPGHESTKTTKPISLMKYRLLSYDHIRRGEFNTDLLFEQLREVIDEQRKTSKRIGTCKARSRR